MSSLIDVSYSPYSMNTIYTLMVLQKAILINVIYTEQGNILTSKIKCVQGQVLINFPQAFFPSSSIIFYIYLYLPCGRKKTLWFSPHCVIFCITHTFPLPIWTVQYMVLKSSTSLHQCDCDSFLALSTSKQLEACSCILDAPLTALLLICEKFHHYHGANKKALVNWKNNLQSIL